MKMNGLTDGVSIFDNLFNAKIGWLFFLIVLTGYIISIVYCSIDNNYSKRAKLSFQITVGFTALLFVVLVIWVLADKRFIFTRQQISGFTYKGGFGFAFYWFIIHFITSGVVLLLYKQYQGKGEISVYRWILVSVQNGISTNKANTNPTLEKYSELRAAKQLLDEGVFTELEYLTEKQSILEKYR